MKALWYARVEFGNYLVLNITGPLQVVIPALAAALAEIPLNDVEMRHALRVEVRPA